MKTIYSKIELLRACIQALRNDNDPLRKIAEKTGVQTTQIHYIKGEIKKSSSLETLFKLAKFYNIPYDFSNIESQSSPEPLTPEEQIRQNFVSCLSCQFFQSFKCGNPESILHNANIDQTTVCKKYE